MGMTNTQDLLSYLTATRDCISTVLLDLDRFGVCFIYTKDTAKLNKLFGSYFS